MNQTTGNPDKVEVLKDEKLGVEEQYLQFFVHNPRPAWQQADDNFSLDQPSPLKFVPSETTYGIESLLCPDFNG
jgi:hypothetical protein